MRIPTDPDTRSCGSPEWYRYKLQLAAESINHS